MKMMKKIDTTLSPQLAYLVGVIASDGNLSPDGRHINITSKDGDWLLIIRNAFGLTCRLGKKSRGGSTEKKYTVLQIGDKHFYQFLLGIGLTPKKSKTIGRLRVHPEFFGDFLRGCIDGDGTITSTSHPESRHKQLRLRLYSASPCFLDWIQEVISEQVDISGGWIYHEKNRSVSALSYGKADSTKILRYIYHDKKGLCLERKRQIAHEFISQTS